MLVFPLDYNLHKDRIIFCLFIPLNWYHAHCTNQVLSKSLLKALIRKLIFEKHKEHFRILNNLFETEIVNN